jgi:hypothetical protein
MILPVPVKPWVRHLLVKQYGKEPIAVRSNSDIGSILILAVSDPDSLRLSIDDISEENQEELVSVNFPDDVKTVRFLLGGKFKKGVIITDMLPMISNSLESYFKIFLKGYSIGYRSLLNSEAASGKAFANLYSFKEDVIKEDNLIKIIQRESKEMANPFKNLYSPKRNKVVLK